MIDCFLLKACLNFLKCLLLLDQSGFLSPQTCDPETLNYLYCQISYEKSAHTFVLYNLVVIFISALVNFCVHFINAYSHVCCDSSECMEFLKKSFENW
jgi:hypothetical protein